MASNEDKTGGNTDSDSDDVDEKQQLVGDKQHQSPPPPPPPSAPSTQSTQSSPNDHGVNWKKVALIAAATGGAAVLLAPVAISAAGFTATGIAAKSIAASMMSSAAIANGGWLMSAQTTCVDKCVFASACLYLSV